jgi:nicotinate (nicotinamide) nucleotide adenylyltransferase
LNYAQFLEALPATFIPTPFPFMIEPFHDFQLISQCHGLIEEIRGDPHPRILVVPKAKVEAERVEQGVGVFPASFNPITEGHVAIVRRATEIGAFQEIVLLLDIQAMDKEIFGTTLVDRLLVLRILFEGDPQVSVGVSNRGLFLAKVDALKEASPQATDITFIVGSDTLERVFDAKYYDDREGALEQLFASCTFMVVHRGGHGRGVVQKLMSSPENERFKERIRFFEIPYELAQVSSSAVRQRVTEGRSIGRLVPAQVRRFIEKAKPYEAECTMGPRDEKVDLYEIRTQALSRLYDLFPEGGVHIDIGKIVEGVMEGMKGGGNLETVLDDVIHRRALSQGRVSCGPRKGSPQ